MTTRSRGNKIYSCIKENLRKIWHWESDFRPWIFLAFFSSVIAVIGYQLVWRQDGKTLVENAYVEFIGFIFDVIFIGLLVGIYNHARLRRERIHQQQEIIDDYKKWNSEEARFRIAGAVRRINRLGKTDVDFSGIELKDFSFLNHGIRTIRSSTFYDGSWGTGGPRDITILERVNFLGADCSNVIFSPFDPISGIGFAPPAKLIDCAFVQSNLSNAKFNGALLRWTTPPPKELGVWNKMEDGQDVFDRTYTPPFLEANLNGASFEGAVIENGDFREATNILGCNFTKAKGLNKCVFDEDMRKKLQEKFPDEFDVSSGK